MSETMVGRVVHYFDKIGVAAIDLTGDLAVGDEVKFVRAGEVLLEQEVGSIQIEHEHVESAKKGQSIGLKTAEKVRKGVEVFKIG